MNNVIDKCDQVRCDFMGNAICNAMDNLVDKAMDNTKYRAKRIQGCKFGPH